MTRRRVRIGALAAACCLCASSARAFTIETLITDGCHEALTAEALAAVRARGLATPAIPLDPSLQPLVDDLQFHLPSATSDALGLGLELAVRDNDLDGHSPTDLDALALVHGDPAHQEDHCLRNVDDDYALGSDAALARCRARIRSWAVQAIEALDADGALLAGDTSTLTVSLAIRGQVDVPLPTASIALGHALHAIQDSFSHTARTDDGMSVETNLNWVDVVDDDFSEPRDGPAHRSALDECDATDAIRTRNRALAVAASTDLLAAVMQPASDPSIAFARVDAVLDRYLGAVEGCTYANAWCGNGELSITDPSGCAVAHPGARGRSTTVAIGAALVAIASVGRRLRSRARARRVGAVVALLSLLAPTRARAADDDAHPFGVAASIGGAYDHAAIAASIGARLRLDERWRVGADVEWNPWITVQTADVRRGALNVFGTLTRIYPLHGERFDLHTNLSIGASRMLFDLYGVPSGTTGLFLAVDLLGVEFRVGHGVRISIEPAHVALPVPQLSGAPFGYLQYRIQIGAQWGG